MASDSGSLLRTFRQDGTEGSLGREARSPEGFAELTRVRLCDAIVIGHELGGPRLQLLTEESFRRDVPTPESFFGAHLLGGSGVDFLFFVPTSEPMVTWYPPGGEPVALALPGVRARTVTPEARERYRERTLTSVAGDSLAVRIFRQALDSVAWGSTPPVVDRLVGSRDGRILVRLVAETEAAEDAWLMLDPDGAAPERFLLPAGADITDASATAVVTLERGDGGGVRVAVYRW